jgi:glycosyltransferase involved in cell wall biosynthesis
MKLLLACEFYHPSRGGVQEVMRQLAERFVTAGHDVTVATTFIPERTFSEWNGVKIAEFDISGNHVRGLRGEVERYQEFLAAFDGDALLIKAAQQWTFDASWPALDKIRCKKVFIPCGFSALYEPTYAEYFKKLPSILDKFDNLIFYAEEYRDVNFVRAHGLTKLTFLPNGASEEEFSTPPAPGIRTRLGIPEDALLMITVGTPTGMKGHFEVAEAFARLDSRGRRLALVLNGQWGARPIDLLPQEVQGATKHPPELDRLVADLLPQEGKSATKIRQRASIGGLGAIKRRARATLAQRGLRAFAKRVLLWTYFRTLRLMVTLLRLMLKPVRKAAYFIHLVVSHALFPNKRPPPPPRTIDQAIADAEYDPLKTVRKIELARPEVIELFFAADLFVFASKVEYSPLVLFEACAAGLPFISVPAGNSEEIARWTGGGVICPAEKDERGYVKVDPAVLASEIDRLLQDDNRRSILGESGRQAWEKRYSWNLIATLYLAVLSA